MERPAHDDRYQPRVLPCEPDHCPFVVVCGIHPVGRICTMVQLVTGYHEGRRK